MKEKSYKSNIVWLFGIVTIILAIMVLVMCINPIQVSAEGAPDSGKYQLDINLTLSAGPSSGNTNFVVYLYGKSTSGSVTKLANNSAIGFAPTKIEVVIPMGSTSKYHKYYGRIYDFKLSGPVSFSVNNVNEGSMTAAKSYAYTMSGIADGKYTLTFTKDEYYYASTMGGTSTKYMDKKTVSFSFIVATTPKDPCANGHDYISKVIHPTCLANGYTLHTCSRCDNNYKSDTVQATGHSYSSNVVQPTCINGGYTAYNCNKCGHNYNGNVTAPLGHNYTEVVVDSTCTEGGYTIYKCVTCGVSHSDNPTQETGHRYQSTVVSATCTERGYTLHTCIKCGDKYKDNETEVLAHDYLIERVPPDCDNSGYSKYTCSRCGRHYTSDETVAMGHNYQTTIITADCVNSGYTLHECKDCGKSYKDNESKPLGHNYTSSVKPPSCTENGQTIYSCQVCGYEYSDNDGVFPSGHNYTNTIIKKPTCLMSGVMKCECEQCGDVVEKEIAETGHNYKVTDTKSNNGITMRTYKCENCGHTYTQELGDQYNEISNYIEYLFQQYLPYMWWVLLATAGVWSIGIGVAYAIAHKNEDKEKAKKMLANYVVGLVVIAIIVVACPYLVRGIAMLIT